MKNTLYVISRLIEKAAFIYAMYLGWTLKWYYPIVIFLIAFAMSFEIIRLSGLDVVSFKNAMENRDSDDYKNIRYAIEVMTPYQISIWLILIWMMF